MRYCPLKVVEDFFKKNGYDESYPVDITVIDRCLFDGEMESEATAAYVKGYLRASSLLRQDDVKPVESEGYQGDVRLAADHLRSSIDVLSVSVDNWNELLFKGIIPAECRDIDTLEALKMKLERLLTVLNSAANNPDKASDDNDE